MWSSPVIKITTILLCTYFQFQGSLAVDRCYSPTKNFRNETNGFPLPKCVGPIENLLNGRFLSGLGKGGPKLTKPPWFNATLATIGQKFVGKYWLSTNLATLISQLFVFSQVDLANAFFYYIGIQNMQEEVKVLGSLLLQSQVWLKEDMYGAQKDLIKSVDRIRRIHVIELQRQRNRQKLPLSRSPVVEQELWSAVEKDLKMSNIVNRTVSEKGKKETQFTTNQFSLGCLEWGFAAMPLIRPEAFGIPIHEINDEELEGFLHFWAYVWYSIGLEDEYNICLQPNAREAKIYFERMLNELLVPYFFELSYESKVLIETGVKGFGRVLGPVARLDFMLRRMLEDIIRIPSPNLIQKTSFAGRLLDAVWKRFLIPGVRSSRILRRITNSIFNFVFQVLSFRVFGFVGTNRSVVVERAWLQEHRT